MCLHELDIAEVREGTLAELELEKLLKEGWMILHIADAEPGSAQRHDYCLGKLRPPPEWEPPSGV